MRTKVHGIVRGLVFLLMAALAATLFSFPLKWLWNWLMPGLFGLHAISFWQALGLLVLSKILFSGFHARPGASRDWRMRFIRRWDQMTPEEREKFRAGLHKGCGPAGPSQATPEA
jgi:energy-coupling factor transporter transmembrane protein EcfT